MMNNKFKKVLAVALMTGFLTTSIGLGISEAAPAKYRPTSGPSHHQQMRPHVHKAGPARHAHVHRAPGMYARGPVHHAPAHRAPGMYARGPVHHAPAHRAPGMYTRGPVHHAPAYRAPGMYTRGPVHRVPVIHRHYHPVLPSVYQGPVVIHHHPFPPHHHHKRTMHRKDWARAAVTGAVIGAVVAGT